MGGALEVGENLERNASGRKSSLRKKLAWMAVGLLLGFLPNLIHCSAHSHWN